jgi:putative transposase
MTVLNRNDGKKHHRCSHRLQKWDYSWPGVYFVTLNLSNIGISFGQITSGKMILNTYGKILSRHWQALPGYYKEIVLDEWCIMPEHFHAIIKINRQKNDGSQEFAKPVISKARGNPDADKYRNIRRKMLLSKIIGRFKMMTAKEINLSLHSSGKVWQRDYYESVISDEHGLERVRNYIKENPVRY